MTSIEHEITRLLGNAKIYTENKTEAFIDGAKAIHQKLETAIDNYVKQEHQKQLRKLYKDIANLLVSLKNSTQEKQQELQTNIATKLRELNDKIEQSKKTKQ